MDSTRFSTVPAYLRPGVYIEEVPDRDPALRSVTYRVEVPAEAGEVSPPRWIAEHAIAAFVGLAEQGAAHLPTLVQSWDEYVRRFGGLLKGRYLGEAVLGFFANGGQSCYVVRVNDIAGDSTGIDDLIGSSEDRTGPDWPAWRRSTTSPRSRCRT